MTNRRMLLTGVALSTGLLLVGEGCMSAAPRGATVAMATPTPMSMPMSSPTPAPMTTPTPASEQQAAPTKEEPFGTRHARVVDAMRGCRLMKTQAGNTKGPSYTDVCVR